MTVELPGLEGKGKPGAAFEKLAAAVQKRLDPGATVTWNEIINGRQIDVAIRGTVGSATVLVVAECRDYRRPLGEDHVDRFDSVAREVGANRALLVTRTGFTRDALDKAAKVGIDTCVLREAVDDDLPAGVSLLKEIGVTVNLVGTALVDIEAVAEDGRCIPCDWCDQVENVRGSRDFMDRVLKGWLATEEGKRHEDGEVATLALEPPLRLLRDDEQPVFHKVRFWHYKTSGPSFASLWTAPAQWVFLKVTPTGTFGESEFFNFDDLVASAKEFAAGVPTIGPRTKEHP